MNEQNEPVQPPIIGPVSQPQRACPGSRPFSWWMRKLCACNPFYLVSAALLLYGCYRVSLDTPLFHLETARLLFNFTAIQFYEVLLAGTAVFLARRAIWYDSTLLVVLENLLVFVPFIYISQAALTDWNMGLVMCVAGGAMAIARFASLKRWFTRLNLPVPLLLIGFVLLVLNITLPLIYRRYGEHIVGAFINSGPAHAMNLRVWMLVLPAVLALANFLPTAKPVRTVLFQHRWLPYGLFSLWMVVTSVHLYCLGYIYQFDFDDEQLAPAVWVLAWTLYFQVTRNVPNLNRQTKHALAFLPVLMPMMAFAPGRENQTFLILTALNLAVYGTLGLFYGNYRLARHLGFASGVMLIAGLPESWREGLIPGLTGPRLVAAGFLAYLLFWTMRLRDPRIGIMGAVVLTCAAGWILGNDANAGAWALQSGLAFLLIHSLRWQDAKHAGAAFVRALGSVAWITQSFFWAASPDAKYWMPLTGGAAVLGCYLFSQLLCTKWDRLVVPASALMVMLAGPANAVADRMIAIPMGLLAVAGSFLLFGFGTVAALTRHIWQKNGDARDARLSKYED